VRRRGFAALAGGMVAVSLLTGCASGSGEFGANGNLDANVGVAFQSARDGGTTVDSPGGLVRPRGCPSRLMVVLGFAEPCPEALDRLRTVNQNGGLRSLLRPRTDQVRTQRRPFWWRDDHIAPGRRYGSRSSIVRDGGVESSEPRAGVDQTGVGQPELLQTGAEQGVQDLGSDSDLSGSPFPNGDGADSAFPPAG
jgi:hypothetical protein